MIDPAIVEMLGWLLALAVVPAALYFVLED